MSRKIKPRPDNGMTERYRGQLQKTQVNVEGYIEHQRSIGDNLIVIDKFIRPGVCKDFLENALYNNDGHDRWLPNIEYGKGKPWPVSEWGYTLVEPETEDWFDSKMTEKSKNLWNEVKGYIEDEFKITPKINGAHLNATTFGQESMIHQDSPDGSNIFAILFFNDDMNAYDGGELQTYINLNPDDDENVDFFQSEVNYSISPQVGKLVLADARILHRGLAPSRFYAKTRFTMAIKMKFDNPQEAWDKLQFKW